MIDLYLCLIIFQYTNISTISIHKRNKQQTKKLSHIFIPVEFVFSRFCIISIKLSMSIDSVYIFNICSIAWHCVWSLRTQHCFIKIIISMCI